MRTSRSDLRRNTERRARLSAVPFFMQECGKAFGPMRVRRKEIRTMTGYRKVIITILVIAIAASASLAARPYHGYYRPASRGEWFSLGFGAGTDAITFPVGGKAAAQSFSSVQMAMEFAMFPQRAQGNFLLRLSFGILQQKDVFGRVPEGGTLDAAFMYRWQHSSGFALGVGGGCYFPGFNEALKPSPEAVIEPSFAFNLTPQNAMASLGTVRISAPVAARYDMALGQWYISVSVGVTVYVI